MVRKSEVLPANTPDWFWQWNKFENRSIFDEVKA